MQTVAPYLSVRNAADAIELYQRVFAAQLVPPTLRFPDGKIAHAELKIGSATIFLSEEAPEMGGPSPETLGGTTFRLNLMVVDADAAVAVAAKAGFEVLIPVSDHFYGHRSGRLKDPFGHLWIISQKIEDVAEDEMQRRMNEMMQGS